MKSTAKWYAENQFLVNNSKNFTVLIDGNDKYYDKVTITSIDLILMGLSSSIASQFEKIINNMLLAYHDFEIEIEMHLLESSKFVNYLEVSLIITSNSKKDLLQKCLDSAIRTCPVCNHLKGFGVPVKTRIEIKNYIISNVN